MAPFGLLPTLIELWRSIVHDRAWCPGQVWREGFLRPMLLKMVTALRPGGSKHFATDVESIKAPWSQMTAWDQELKWKVTAFAGHLILSVTTRRSHRRSGLEAKLSREMERWKRTCFCVRFAKDHGRLEPLNAMGMSFNRNNWTIIYIYICTYNHNNQRSNNFFIIFGRQYPRIWRVMSTELSKNLGLFKTAAVQIGIVDLFYTATWFPRLRLFWKLVATSADHIPNIIHSRREILIDWWDPVPQRSWIKSCMRCSNAFVLPWFHSSRRSRRWPC